MAPKAIFCCFGAWTLCLGWGKPTSFWVIPSSLQNSEICWTSIHPILPIHDGINIKHKVSSISPPLFTNTLLLIFLGYFLVSFYYYYWSSKYTVVLVSVIQWIESAICIHISPPCWTSFPLLSPFHPSRSSHREGNGTPLQHSCLENPTDRGAW